jgi:hypothetical protein
MAERYVRIGSMEDIHLYDDGDFDAAFETDHAIKVHQAPTAGEDVLRRDDVPGYVGESMWPIGSVFLSVTATNPNALLGFGTWARIAEGQFLVGQLAADADFGTAETTGGDKDHTHSVDVPNTTSGAPSATTEVDNELTGSTVNVASNTHSHDVDPVSFNSGNNSELPPYFVIYAWKRTA